jgi:hypothetical protein
MQKIQIEDNELLGLQGEVQFGTASAASPSVLWP